MRVELDKDLRWKDVVIPQFYDAYRCEGHCKFPLDKKVSVFQLFNMVSRKRL